MNKHFIFKIFSIIWFILNYNFNLGFLTKIINGIIKNIGYGNFLGFKIAIGVISFSLFFYIIYHLIKMAPRSWGIEISVFTLTLIGPFVTSLLQSNGFIMAKHSIGLFTFLPTQAITFGLILFIIFHKKWFEQIAATNSERHAS